MNAKHTPEPWKVTETPSEFDGEENDFHGDHVDHEGKPGRECHNYAFLATCDGTHGQRKANAARIVACVNAMAGIENPDEFVKAAFAVVAEIQDDNGRDSLDSCSKSALAKLAAFFPSLAPKGA